MKELLNFIENIDELKCIQTEIEKDFKKWIKTKKDFEKYSQRKRT